MTKTQQSEVIFMDEMTAVLQENMELYAENQRLWLLIYGKGGRRSNVSNSARDKEMKSLRWDHSLTLQEIADKFNISRERVRQIVGSSSQVNMKANRRKKQAAGMDSLTNSEIAENLGIKPTTVSRYRNGTRYTMEPCNLRIGTEKENEYAEKLAAMGMEVKLMPYMHKFDALVNGLRVDFKYCGTPKAAPSMHNINPTWNFGVRKNKRDYCDIYFCITGNDDVFIIPSIEVPAHMDQLVFCYPTAHNSKGKWQSYKDRYDFLQPTTNQKSTL